MKGIIVSTYPVRQPYFAFRYLRWLTKTCAAQTVGPEGMLLLMAVVTQEDAVRYRAVTFYNNHLADILGIRKIDTLAAVRRRVVEAGLLHYQPGRMGSREPGVYWVKAPAGFDNFTDTPADEGDPIEAAYLRGYADAKAKRPAQPYPRNGDGQHEPTPFDGAGVGVGIGYGRGVGIGEPSVLSLTLPLNTSAAQAPQANGRTLKRKKSEPTYTPEDMTLANEMLTGIRAVNPNFSDRDLPTWAQTFRLMREADNRSPEQIRALVRAVQVDDFERTVVLSPAKLRKRWDVLETKLLRKSVARPANPSRIHTGRYDNAPDRY